MIGRFLMVGSFFNVITAWASVALLVLVSAIWILRILVQNKIVAKQSVLFRCNRSLRKYHKLVGIAFLVVAFIHGVLSSNKVFSINWGSASFFIILIMGVSYLVKYRVTRKVWLGVHRILTIGVIATLIIHLISVGIYGFKLVVQAPISIEEYYLNEEQIKEIEPTKIPDTYDGIVYNNGVYEGVADGYGPYLRVEVRILDNKITEVVIVSHNEERRRFYATPIAVLPSKIVETQDVEEVDIISGATFTSIGIKNAVIDALNKAIVFGDVPLAQELPTERGKPRR